MRIHNQIQNAVETMIVTTGSAAKAAKKLGISPAHMSNIRNSRFDLVSDKTMRKLSHELGLKQEGWVIVDTKPLKEMKAHMTKAQQLSINMCIVAPSGSGKKESCLDLTEKNVFRISCEEHWNKKNFLQEIMSAMGVKYEGLTTHELVRAITDQLSRLELPLLILDEADKLRDEVLYFYITIYNRLEDRSGIVLLATDYLKKRILKGLALNRKGYQEIYSRIGRRFIEVEAPDHYDVAAVCQANGVTDMRAIEQIVNSADGDMRRVKRHVLRIREQKGVSA